LPKFRGRRGVAKLHYHDGIRGDPA
jgi:hypothetical protein